MFCVVLIACVAAFWAFVARSSTTDAEAPRPSAQDRIECVSAVELGRVEAGSPASNRLLLRNPTSAGVVVSRGESSCPCIELQEVPIEIDPGGEAEVRIGFAPEEDLEFRGKLAATLVGLDPEGGKLFECRVHVEVVGRAAASPTADDREGGGPGHEQ
jgi:hypothetical protein